METYLMASRKDFFLSITIIISDDQVEISQKIMSVKKSIESVEPIAPADTRLKRKSFTGVFFFIENVKMADIEIINIIIEAKYQLIGVKPKLSLIPSIISNLLIVFIFPFCKRMKANRKNCTSKNNA
jgi:hypothetical protein